jgi:CBS domain-containing protein
MRVVDVMIRDPICCAESCTVETVAHLLSKVDCGVVPVLNQLSRQVIGVITERSICLGLVAQRRNTTTVPAGECMTCAPAVCHPEDDVYAVLAIFAQSTSRGVVVINEEDELVGVLSLSVLASRAAAAAQELYAALQRVNEENASRAGSTHGRRRDRHSLVASA